MRTKLPFIALAATLLEACVASTPGSHAPQAHVPPAYGSTTLALVVSAHTRETIRELDAKNGTSNPFKLVNMAPYKGEALVERVIELLTRHFKEVRRAASLEEASQAGCDLVANLDASANLGTGALATTSFETEVSFSDSGRNPVATIQAAGAKTIPFPATTFKIAEAVEDARRKLEAKLIASNELQRFVAGGGVRPVSAAAPAAPQPASKPRFPLEPLVSNFPKGESRPDDIAVIIANADYGRLGKEIPDVLPAYADAEGFRRLALSVLGVREGNIIYLKDATGAQFARVFGTDKDHKGQLFDWVKPGHSKVYVYYAGHGAPSTKGQSYLVPADADAGRLDLNGFPLELLYSNLGKLPAVSVTVVLEACFSGTSQGGTLIPNASPLVLTVKTPAVPETITVLSAGAMDQVASWGENGRGSLFTEYLLKGWGGEADKAPTGNKNGRIDLSELESYLRANVTYLARRYYGRDQVPQVKIGRSD